MTLALSVGARVLALALALLSAAPAAGEVPIPPLKARVTDLSGTLSAPQLQALERSLRDFEARKGSQIAVLMLPSTQPETIEQYSIRVAEAWKIGRARIDDGAILVIAKDEHRLRIEVGRGLEGAIPDVIASRVIREVIAPHFLANDFYGGIAAGTGALMKLIEGEQLAPAQGRSRQSWDDYESLFVLVLVLALVLGRMLSALFGRTAGASLVSAIAGGTAWLVTGALIAALLA
ncbi:MAG: TPM domain-containing protein, partial [Betaproteobacteria bacterium]|nr:TPM domain-containing protein [Betaproteobacteria bacterium]